MSIEFNIQIALKEDEKARTVFKKILNSRVVSRKELYEIDLPGDELNIAIKKLQSLNLIEIKTASIEELDRYIPTREGLEAEQMI